ncbi:hypothetical protein OS493_025603 [Desmophyllum pertusum]|uniref:Uncharacterized protein n=1 Tax=Desmophyllum pertusum TaxID=174260 RepID=A0A9W9ZYR5_9CNID|nr:hypothetical protein OS493_025603 [Desmophyllum pertusum]
MASATEADDSLQDQLLQEIDKRAKFSTKSRTARGTFTKKDTEHLSWKNYVRVKTLIAGIQRDNSQGKRIQPE